MKVLDPDSFAMFLRCGMLRPLSTHSIASKDLTLSLSRTQVGRCVSHWAQWSARNLPGRGTRY